MGRTDGTANNPASQPDAVSYPPLDCWAQWLLHRRYASNQAEQEMLLERLKSVRYKVLDNVELVEGDTLLDVGTGDGLIAFGALERVGKRGQVIFSDISQDLLDRCRAIAQQIGVVEQCRFVQASADNLRSVATGSVDAVTTRSVLIYVQDKALAFREFHRVLKPGGRLSIFEPINRFGYPEAPHLLGGYGLAPVLDIAHKVRDYYDSLQPPATDPMLNFDERDLIAFAEEAGFAELHLELRLDIEPVPKRSWEVYSRMAFNPLRPTLEETMNAVLTPDEAEQLAKHLRPLVEAGQGSWRSAVAYLWAATGPRRAAPTGNGGSGQQPAK